MITVLIFLLFRNYLSSKGGYGEINDIFGGTIDVLICICYVCKATGSFFILEHSGRKPLWGDGVLKDSKVEWSQTKEEHNENLKNFERELKNVIDTTTSVKTAEELHMSFHI